ncbi:MAG: DUF58 domain-containing protein [Thermomonas sp.]|uniref:DUF58 domain-containing protein n=1 Tax=Thermomonas sp. TaxID=1971895 RepID=UPI001EB86A90|nr:DUF58 domain-containing protein [Thermomonas sp.]MBV2209621.1 DUF58 domain-containing protein [Thermomonas sp.]
MSGTLATEGVRPSLAELIELRALVQGRRPARQGRYGVQGHALSNLRGRGMEYAESREYAMGDDARHMDWRLTARSGKAHTKLFQAERERLTLIVADTAPALYFGTRVRFKSVQAARAGALMAWLALRDGDRLAALCGSESGMSVAPVAGVRGVMHVLDALTRWYSVPPPASVPLTKLLEQAQRLLRPGARVLVLADPQSVLDVSPLRWAALAKFDSGILLLTDPLESKPPKAQLSFVGEANERVTLALDAAAVRQRWLQAFEAPVASALALLQAKGIRAAELSSHAQSDTWLGLMDRPKGAWR